jgi:hypothetical protein
MSLDILNTNDDANDIDEQKKKFTENVIVMAYFRIPKFR